MKIIILGGGQVGTSVAEILAGENNDITIVDTNPETLQRLQDRYDLRTVCGQAAHPDVLAQAGAEDAEMILAVTNSDETNMVACQIAKTLFNTPTKIARVRALEYLDHPEIFAQDALAIDVRISPEQLVTDYVKRLIKNPGALQVLDFANGLVSMVGVKAFYGGQLVGNKLSALREHMPGIDTRVAAIFREDATTGQDKATKQTHSIQPDGDTVIQVDDEVYFIAPTKHIRAIMGELRKLERPINSIILAGGGNIGKRLAQALQNDYQVKLIERDPARARMISEQLDRTIVLRGDAADEELLLNENIEHTDVFCALTNDDEANILSSMLAKRLGARRVMSLINKPSYVDLVENTIDNAISPQQATISGLLRNVRGGDVVAGHSLRRGGAIGTRATKASKSGEAIEAIEVIVHGGHDTSKVVGRSIEEIKLPKGATIAALVRGTQVIIAHHDTIIESGDHVILLLVDKEQIPKVTKLFSVSANFF